MLCGPCRDYRAFEAQSRNCWERICEFFRTDLKEFFQDTLTVCCPCFVTGEYTGVIRYVLPQCKNEEALPENMRGKCYHLITMMDGREFKLYLPTVPFKSLESQLEPGSVINIIYNKPDRSIINIYPTRRHTTRIISLQNLLEDDQPNIDEETMVRAHYVDEDLDRVEILHQPKVIEI